MDISFLFSVFLVDGQGKVSWTCAENLVKPWVSEEASLG